jgi:leucyl/phenylalanyl-tRNA--protein transferase
MPIYQLSKGSYLFPPGAMAEHDGLLAYGGDMSIARLLSAYAGGIFPWDYSEGQILWWCPKNRFVIFPEEIHISRSMKKLISKEIYQVKFNTPFDQIIKGCKKTREGATWISDEVETAYNRLFAAGYAMCVGVFQNNELVGGLYGVVIGRCFFGESMFSLAPSASKFALIKLCEKLASENFAFIDCQFHTPHLQTMGGRFISWNEYRRLLREGCK